MARSDKVRLDCRALPYLQPVTRVHLEQETGAAFLSSGSRTPARAAVEARSDLSFINELVTEIASAAADEDAAAAALTVLCSPTIVARTNGKGSESLILQSVVLERRPDEFETQVTAQMRSVPGKPGTLKVESVEVGYVDLGEHSDRCDLVSRVEDWWREYPMPTVKLPEPFPLRDWAWIGNPEHVGILEVPADWKARVERLGAVHGVRPLVVETVGQISSWNLTDRIEHAVLLRGSKVTEPFQDAVRAADGPMIEIFERAFGGQTFEALVSTVRGVLLDEAVAAAAPTPTSRDLAGGEIVYHRKVGDSQKFDRFDAGSTTPCTHGADGFMHPDKAPKAVKGMTRRYNNFTPSMLIHCEKFPNCGMYGVDAARGGLKATN